MTSQIAAAALPLVASRQPAAAIVVFATGVLSSLGPCGVTRAAAVARGGGSALLRGTAMIGGVVAVYAAFGFSAPLLAFAVRGSSFVYLALAVVAVFGALQSLRSLATPECRGAHAGGHSFFVGALSALVLSPCCTPLAFALMTYGAATGDASYSAMMLATFALGHALPTMAAAVAANRLALTLRRPAVQMVSGTVTFGVLIGTAAYYAVLA